MLTRAQVEKIKTYGKWGDDIDALCDMALAWLEVQSLLQQVSELSLRESNGVKDSAVHSQHDAAVVVKNVRAFLSALPTPRQGDVI